MLEASRHAGGIKACWRHQGAVTAADRICKTAAVELCLDMYMDVCVDMRILSILSILSIGMFIDMLRDMYIDMYVDIASTMWVLRALSAASSCGSVVPLSAQSTGHILCAIRHGP